PSHSPAATRPTGRKPELGRAIVVSSFRASGLVPTIRVGNVSPPRFRTRHTCQCHSRLVASTRTNVKPHETASHSRENDDWDQKETVTTPDNPNEIARISRRNSSAGVNRWA